MMIRSEGWIRLRVWLLGVAWAVSASAAETVKTYQHAVQEAKRSRADHVIFCMGSGWMKQADLFRTAYERTVSANPGHGMIWSLYDLRADLNAEGRKALGTLPMEIYGYPAWIFTDADGRILGVAENISLNDLASLPLTVKSLALKRKKRDIALTKAESAEGVERARLIGQALVETVDPLIEKFPFRTHSMILKSYADLTKKMLEADPEDRSGNVFKYTFNYLPILEGTILKNNAAKAFDKNYAYLREKLAIPVLTPKQRQQLSIFRYTTAMASDDLKGAMRYLDETVAIAPKSDFAEDCRRLKRYHTEPLSLPALRWIPSDNRPRWTPFTVDVSSRIQGTGRYTLTFRHQEGKTLFRQPKLSAANQVIASADGEKTAYTLTVDRLPPGRVLLTGELKGTGWFAGRGEIVIEKE